jgi:predicted NBD/HSP70 family sugar kinase
MNSSEKCRTHHINAPLDKSFWPAALANQGYLEAVKRSGKMAPLVIGMERENGHLSRFETPVLDEPDDQTLRHVERLVKFLVWAWGGWKIHVGGSRTIGEHIRSCYAPGGARAFDVDLMSRVYERAFEVAVMEADDVPAEREATSFKGGHWDGCRIGFDLGASDYKVAAVEAGTPVFSAEFAWNPKDQADPGYHFTKLNEGIAKAARYLPRLDAIGGSTAGVVVDNQIRVASLFRSVPVERFGEAKTIFRRLQQQWGVPVEVANDGDVTALAGALSLGVKSVLGIAMGSSQAAGYLDHRGRMTGWLNELAFAPVDYHPQAATDEWSGDRGVGALYFSQQAVHKLLSSAGIELPHGMGLPERLTEVQALMTNGDRRAAAIYETIGVYLGYAIAQYAEFYEVEHVLVLGRVMTGVGGTLLLAKAGEVLWQEFPGLAERVRLHVPDESSRRVGQAVAAASLPAITRQER